MSLRWAALFGFILSSCAPALMPANSGTGSCTSGTATILVFDTSLTRGCGCAEGSGTVSAGGAFACTVNSGTTVFFYFVATRISHQILFTSAPATTSNLPLVRPLASQPGRAISYGVPLSTSGAYLFSDAFNSAITGTLTVL